MNIWNNTILTEKGLALMSKLTQGTSLEITRAATGAGFVTPGMLVKETDVTGLKQELAFRPASYPETGKCAITVALRNDGLAIGYTATQVGMFAMDPDEGEILLLISQSNDATSGTIVPSEKEMPGFSSEWTFYLQYGQADGVTVVVDPSNTVTRNEMEEYVAKEAAAGRTMTGDIDMGGNKISNVGEPTQGSDVATRHFVEQHTIEGNTYVAVDYNKDGNIVLKPYVADEDELTFKSHISNKNNPHGVTATQVGAASAGYGYGEKVTSVNFNTTAEMRAYLDEILLNSEGRFTKRYVFVCPEAFGYNVPFFCELNRYEAKFAHLDACSVYGKRGRLSKIDGSWGNFEWFAFEKDVENVLETKIDKPKLIADMDTFTDTFGIVGGPNTKNHPLGSVSGFAINATIGVGWKLQYIFYLANPGIIVSRAQDSGTWTGWSKVTLEKTQQGGE